MIRKAKVSDLGLIAVLAVLTFAVPALQWLVGDGAFELLGAVLLAAATGCLLACLVDGICGRMIWSLAVEIELTGGASGRPHGGEWPYFAGSMIVTALRTHMKNQPSLQATFKR